MSGTLTPIESQNECRLPFEEPPFIYSFIAIQATSLA